MEIIGFSHLEPYSRYSHDSNICFIKDGEVKLALIEERLQRVKHYAGYPSLSLAVLTRRFNFLKNFPEIVAVANSDVRWFKTTAMLTNIKRCNIPLEKLSKINNFESKVELINHQLCHAAVAFCSSKFKESLILTLDGAGWDDGYPSMGGIFLGNESSISKIDTFRTTGNSLGFFYSAVTQALGWQNADGEGKTMALASFADDEKVVPELQKYAPKVVGCRLEGGTRFNQEFWVANGRFFIDYLEDQKSLSKLIEQYGRESVAASAQKVLEDVVLNLIDNILDFYNKSSLCLGGGIFLNVKLNQAIQKKFPNVEICIPPNTGDSGVALGAAVIAHQRETGYLPTIPNLPYLGLEFTDEEIFSALIKYNNSIFWSKESDITQVAAKEISKMKVIGWFQGREEWSPRALGNRSILAHPARREVKNRLNNVLKKRDCFMPFAPTILEEYSNLLFIDSNKPSPFMQYLYDVKKEAMHMVQGVIHVDGTSRPQILKKGANPKFYDLILKFMGLTGLPLILNTSFNIHGQPIVNTPEDAISHLIVGCVDSLCIGNYFVQKY